MVNGTLIIKFTQPFPQLDYKVTAKKAARRFSKRPLPGLAESDKYLFFVGFVI
jgi:hypothetical protein